MKRNPILRTWSDDFIIADSFAGGGGASSGIELALGRSPDIAINHDPEAIAMHAANHPNTQHFIENVWEVDPVAVAAGRTVGVAWFSPTCTSFSKAKGAALDPETIKIRALPWLMVRWAAAVKPRFGFLENVEEIEKWGPVHRQHSAHCKHVACAPDCPFGTKAKHRSKAIAKRHTRGCPGVSCATDCHINRPIKAREGETWRAFIKALRRHYKHVEWRILRACDFGAPTMRKRLFLIASDEDIIWPTPTHGPGRAEPHRTAAECIDWTISCPSIFERERPLADKTLARIARGVRKFVLDTPRPFIVPPAYGDKGGTDVRVNSIDEPLRTIAGNRGGHAVITPMLIKAKSYGGGGNDARPADAPLGTITASKRGEHAIATATLVPAGAFVMPNNTNNVPKSVDEPVPTITTGNRNFLAVPYLVHRSNGERPGQTPRIYDVTEPLRTIVADGEKFAACVAMLIKHNGGNNDAHGSSGQTLDRPMDTLATHNTKSLAVAHLVRYNTENSAGSTRGQSLTEPTSTLDASNRLGLVASHLVKLRGTSKAHVAASSHQMELPMPTITASKRGGTHLGQVEVDLAPADGVDLDRARQVAAFLVRYNGTGDAERVDRPLGTLTSKERYGLVIVELDGEEYIVADIKMRMLTSRELYRAQGFSEDYQIAPEWNGKPLTKTAQIRCCGNSVCPPIAAAIVRAQLGIAAQAAA